MKTFKEYAMTRGFALGSPDSVHPIASIGNMKPPKGKGSRHSRAVGLAAEKNPRIARKPKGTIHGLGFTDREKANQSVSKIKGSGKTHAHKMQAAIAMSQRAKVASQRAKDPQKKKDLGAAHKVYQSYIDKNKKSKD